VIYPPPDQTFLTFTNFEEFNNATQLASSLDTTVRTTGNYRVGSPTRLNKSLREIYEEVNEEENTFLEELSAKHGSSSTLTRAEIGWTPKAKELIESEALLIDDSDILEMNITVPSYADFVNSDGIVKIGNEIYQFKKDYVRVITDGSVSKIALLKNLTTDKNGINVYPVSRERKSVKNAKTQANSSCQNTNGSYRLLAYEDWVGFYLPGGNCNGQLELNNYYLTLRSLKRILGTWQNHNTGELRAEGNVKITHTVSCSNEPFPVLYATIIDDPNYSRSCPFGNTCYIYFMQNYDVKPCNAANSCSGNIYYQGISINIVNNDHHGFGKNGTNCWYGF
jgi:hypothetical protein